MSEHVLLTDAIKGLAIDNEDTKSVLDHIYVDRISLKTKRKILFIYTSSDTWIHKKHVYYLEKAIKDQKFKIDGISVKIIERFELNKNYTPEIFIKEYRPSLTLELQNEKPLLADIMRNAEFSFDREDEITCEVPDNVVTKNRGSEFINIIDRVFNERCGLKKKCVLKMGKTEIHPDDPEKDAALIAAARAISQKADGTQSNGDDPGNADNQKKKAARRTQSLVSPDSDLFYGRDFNEEPAAIEDIISEMPYTVIRGQVMTIESRELKNSRFLVKFSVTDFTDSINVKLFLTEDDRAEIEKILGSKNKPFIKLKGKPTLDTFDNEIVFMSVTGIRKIPDFRETRQDLSAQKRVELHCHTKMSDMDAVTDASKLVKRAYDWGHPAIAITDHGVVQAFPEANHTYQDIDSDYRKKYASEHPDASKDDLKNIHVPFKVLYGCEIYLVDDMAGIVTRPAGQSLDGPVVVFDIETTGFSPEICKIIEIGAVKIEKGMITDRFSAFVDPEVPIPLHIENLTHITDDMVMDAEKIETVLPKFMEFCSGCIMAAHNAEFDMSFIAKNCKDLGLACDNTYIDTLALSRHLLPDLANFRLETVARRLGVSLDNHHRAVDDAECTAGIYAELFNKLRSMGISSYDEINERCEFTPEIIRKLPVYHALVLATCETGRVNLYKLISLSHLVYYGGTRHKSPRVPKSVFEAHREGLIISSACSAGELFQAMLRGASFEMASSIASFYDFIELQPLGNNEYLIRDDRTDSVNSREDLIRIYKKIIDIGEELGKPVVATGDVHFMDPEDSIYRSIVQKGMKFDDADEQAPLYLRTTEEMLEEFSFLDSEKAREIVIKNTNLIADMCECFSPIRAGKFPPVIENSDTDLHDMCYKRAKELYGEDLPKVVTDRLERELNSIISNGYAVMYIIAQKLVSKSNSDGYLVGSRGSVGSSLAATMSGITEVNPLSPHYLCPECHYSDFDSEEVKKYSGRCGFDMPDRTCPVCGHKLNKMGFDIPFETFLGFKGNKEPDIDLNFSGEYQSNAHKYTEVIFGQGQTFRAGTIATLADKTAYGYVKNYFEEKGIHKRNCEIDRLVAGCTGIRRSTGQHPGGIIVLPHGEDINSFTPVQHPANDMNTDIITTHFDYHSIDQNLLKLDILGHDDPTMIKMLENITGVDALSIPLDEPAVMSLFQSTKALGIEPEDIGGCPLGCLGVPEFGTEFVIQMLCDTKPSSFSELVRISGLSHGTDVWLGNAQTLIQEQKATLSTAICTRDDIMLYLISKGIESEMSFTIMESVRKGRGLKPEWEELMRENDVPEWYIWSCKKIKYMFPKAHAAAYVMMAYRIAWFKIYYPLAYYAAYFSIRAKAFDYEMMCMGKERLKYYIDDFTERQDTISKVDQDKLKDMYIVREMYARGFEFLKIDLYRSAGTRFKVEDGKLLPCFNSMNNVGESAAISIENAAKEAPFSSKNDLKNRTKISSTTIEYMDKLGIISDLPDDDQLSIFDLQ